MYTFHLLYVFQCGSNGGSPACVLLPLPLPSSRPKFFSISYSFLKNFAKSYVGATPRAGGWRPLLWGILDLPLLLNQIVLSLGFRDHSHLSTMTQNFYVIKGIFAIIRNGYQCYCSIMTTRNSGKTRMYSSVYLGWWCLPGGGGVAWGGGVCPEGVYTPPDGQNS